MAKNILSLEPVAARKYFLRREAYSNMELPSYFDFGKTLNDVKRIMNDGILTEDELNKAKKYENINHALYGNKDGRYAWRKYEIINPLLYVSLVNLITESSNWSVLQARFGEFQASRCIECESIPVIKREKTKQNAAQISHWVENIEKKSVTLALEYNFLYQTDIADCYSSIYTHSLSWAIHTKSEAKSKRG